MLALTENDVCTFPLQHSAEHSVSYVYPFPPEDIFVDIAIPTGKSLLHLCFVLEHMTLLSSLTLPCVIYDFKHSSLEHSASYEYSSALDAIFMDAVVRTGAISFCFCYLTMLLS